MLTSFFGKSTTINYLLLALLIPATLITKGLNDPGINLQASTLAYGALVILLMVLAFLLYDFILRKNKLTQSNTYGALLFSSFLLTHYQNDNIEIYFALIGALLFYRRIYSLTNEAAIEKKIWDAGFWVFVLALIYPWALFLLAPLAIAIGSLNQFSWRFAVIPFLAGIAVTMLTLAYAAMDPDMGFVLALLPLAKSTPLVWHWPEQTWLIALFGVGCFAVILGAWRLTKSRQYASRASRTHIQWTLYMAALGLVIMGLNTSSPYAVFLLLVAPQVTIILVSVLEGQRNRVVKELMILGILLLPIIEFLLK